MVAVDRPGVDDHLMRARNLTQQLSRPLPYVPTQHREPIFRDPHHVILAVPDRVATRLRVLHNRSVASRSPKGEGFTDPRWGTLNHAIRKLDADIQINSATAIEYWPLLRAMARPTAWRQSTCLAGTYA